MMTISNFKKFEWTLISLVTVRHRLLVMCETTERVIRGCKKLIGLLAFNYYAIN